MGTGKYQAFVPVTRQSKFQKEQSNNLRQDFFSISLLGLDLVLRNAGSWDLDSPSDPLTTGGINL